MIARARKQAGAPDQHLRKAEHNRGWALYLSQHKPDPKFCADPEVGLPIAHDWCATQSYYSAIHYFLYFLARMCPNITWRLQTHPVQSLSDFLTKFPSYEGSFHGAYRQMITNNFKEVESSWRALYDIADTARYNVQEVSADKAALALKCLKVVRGRFYNPPPKVSGPVPDPSEPSEAA